MLLTLVRGITAGLLIASAAAFATGAAIERHSTQPVAAAAPAEHHDTGEGAGTGESAGSGEQPRAGESHAEHGSETMLGINPEATGLVVTAVAVSVVLAVLILTVGWLPLTAGIALVMLAFTALDIREVTHQLNESRQGLAALAAAIALLHLAASAAALLTIRSGRTARAA